MDKLFNSKPVADHGIFHFLWIFRKMVWLVETSKLWCYSFICTQMWAIPALHWLIYVFKDWECFSLLVDVPDHILPRGLQGIKVKIKKLLGKFLIQKCSIGPMYKKSWIYKWTTFKFKIKFICPDYFYYLSGPQ